MKVALTGATGFVGQRLVTSLLADACELRALVPPSADPAPLARRGVEVVSGDVRDLPAVERTLAGAEVVYHLAGVVPGAARTATEYAAVNVGGAGNVARAALTAGVRHLVHCSTVAVHGPPRRALVDEETPCAPVNAYQATKLAAESVIERAVRTHGLSATIARLTAIYGPGDRRSLTLFRDVARGRVLMVGSGTRRCHPTYVDDAVAGLRRCAAHAPCAADRFIIGGEDRPTVNEFVAVIAAALGVTARVIRLPAAPFALVTWLYRRTVGRVTDEGLGPPPGRIDRLDFFLADHAYDVGKARRQLGLRATTPLREGVDRTVAWYRAMGLL
jgi:nucleoside-diphosphate-sugar epimerase